MSRLLCCCPPALRSSRQRSVRLKEEVEVQDVVDSHAVMAEMQSSSMTVSPESSIRRRQTANVRRRAAITSEKSEMLANVRWRSAFAAVRRSTAKSAECIADIVGVLRQQDLFNNWEEPFGGRCLYPRASGFGACCRAVRFHPSYSNLPRSMRVPRAGCWRRSRKRCASRWCERARR